MDQGLGRAAAAARAVSTCGAARTLGRTAPSPPAPVSRWRQPHVRRGRRRGGRGRVWSGPGPRRGGPADSSEPRWPGRARPNVSGCGEPGPVPLLLGLGSERGGAGPLPPGPPPRLAGRAGRSGGGLLLVPAKAKVSFSFGGRRW